MMAVITAIDQDWRRNVTYEHNFGGKTYIYTPEQEINYLYRKCTDKDR
jgi:hypothetical protein